MIKLMAKSALASTDKPTRSLFRLNPTDSSKEEIMRFGFFLAVLAASFVVPGLARQAQAQDQVVETVVCQSTLGNRATCPVNGEVISAGIQRQLGQGAPCFLNFTWGFAENGIWTGNGCSAEFVVTVERAAAQPVTDPNVLRNRLRRTRNALREARKEIAQEQESRRALEAELADAQSALRAAEAAAPSKVKRKRKPQLAVRSVAVCSNKAIRDAKKGGAETANVFEILTARRIDASWLVIGRLVTRSSDQRQATFFRCWTEKGKIINFQNSL